MLKKIKDNLFVKDLINKNYNKVERLLANKKKLGVLEEIFSIKNNQNKTHKVITILGLKIKIKRQNIGQTV